MSEDPGGAVVDTGPASPMGTRRFLDLWPHFVWIGLVVLATIFIAFYPLGRTAPVIPPVGKISVFEKAREHVLVFSVPLSLALLGGFAMAFASGLAKWTRFWIVAGTFLVLSASALNDFTAFIPIFVWCSGMLPNPASLGMAAASGYAGMSLSYLVERSMRGAYPRRRLLIGVAGSSVAIVLAAILLMAPYFSIEWKKPPAVLNDNYELAWETTLPVTALHNTTGFWFRSHGRAVQQVSSGGGPGMGEPPLDEDAVFLTDGWLGRLRPRDGSIVWGRDIDFGVLSDRPTALAAYWDEHRLYVVNRSPAWTIYAFDWLSGELLWETTTPESPIARPDDPRLTLNVTAGYLAMVGEGGKAEYYLIDSQTGEISTRSIPVPQGMSIAHVTEWKEHGFLGPSLVQGRDGSLAILAYFSPAGVEIPEYRYEEGPPPEKGFLFGLHPTTGEITWELEDIGSWRGVLTRFGENLWVNGGLVVRCRTEPDYTTKAWDTSTGQLLWSHAFDELSRSLCTPEGVIVFHDLKTLECFDTRTGDLRWSKDIEVSGDLPSFWLEGETLVASTQVWVRGLDVKTGGDVFGIEASEGNRLMVSDVRDGVMRVRMVERPASGKETNLFVNLASGASVPADLRRMNAAPNRIESYLFALEPGVLPGRSRALGGIVPVFKAQGRLSYVNYKWENQPSQGYLGQFMEEGSVLLTSFDMNERTLHVYMLRPAIPSE